MGYKMKHVIKNDGQVEAFNSKKLAFSIEKTLIANHYGANKARIIAEAVTSSIVEWLKVKTEVTYKDIRSQVTKHLAKHDKGAAIFYKKHKDLW